MPAQLSEAVILAAIEGFESQKARIDQQIAELRALLPGARTASVGSSQSATRKRKFSPEALQRMREAQARRWARVRGESAPAAAEEPKRKRKLSAAGRKAISEAAKKRWAAAKKAGTSATAKKAAPARKKTAAQKAARKTAPVRKVAKTAPVAAAPTAQAGE
jgi:hypothetical protein